MSDCFQWLSLSGLLNSPSRLLWSHLSLSQQRTHMTHAHRLLGSAQEVAPSWLPILPGKAIPLPTSCWTSPSTLANSDCWTGPNELAEHNWLPAANGSVAHASQKPMPSLWGNVMECNVMQGKKHAHCSNKVVFQRGKQLLITNT